MVCYGVLRGGLVVAEAVCVGRGGVAALGPV